MTKSARPPLFRWIAPVIGLALSAAVLFWLYRGLDLERFLAIAASAKTGWLFVLAGTIVLEQLIRGWKWRQILYDLKPVSSLRLFGSIMAAFAVAFIVPLGVSPFVRAWLVARLEGLRFAGVLMTAAIERFLDGIVFALIAALVALAGQIPEISGDVRNGVAVAGGLNLVLFSALLYGLFIGRAPLRHDGARLSRAIDWLAARGGARLEGMRAAILEGIVWPHQRHRQVGAVLASILIKIVAASHFMWAGMAVGVDLGLFDYLFLMVFVGFAIVITHFIRLPGGFVIGSGFALKLLGVADEQALAMILFNHILSIVMMVGIGLLFLWRSGIDIRDARSAAARTDATA